MRDSASRVPSGPGLFRVPFCPGADATRLAKKHLTSGRASLIGVSDDDSVVMLTYLEDLFREKPPQNVDDVRNLVVEAGLKRIRPCLMTSVTTILGLAPIFLHPGRGSDVMQPKAIPSVGGMSVALINLFVIPCCYCLVKEWQWKLGKSPQTAVVTNQTHD